MTNMYSQITHDIAVDVKPEYMPNHSDREEGTFVWSYQVVISNRSPYSVRLISRYWKITNAHAEVTEVEGEGVVGAQPVIDPGNSFVYTSLCPLTTPSGFMQGHYIMKRTNGEEIQVEIPVFSLDLPGNPTLAS